MNNYLDRKRDLQVSSFVIGRNATTSEKALLYKIKNEKLDLSEAEELLDSEGLAFVETGTVTNVDIVNYYVVRKVSGDDDELVEFDSSVTTRYDFVTLATRIPKGELSLEEKRNYIRKNLKTPEQMLSEMLDSDTPPSHEINLEDMREKYDADIDSLCLIVFNWVGGMAFKHKS